MPRTCIGIPIEQMGRTRLNGSFVILVVECSEWPGVAGVEGVHGNRPPTPPIRTDLVSQ